MRVLTCCLVLAFSGTLRADDKIDPAKLVGKWEMKGLEDKGARRVTEFTKDGKVVLIETVNGNDTKIEGTYKVEGNKVVVTAKVQGVERKVTSVVTKLTEAEMVASDQSGFAGTYKRVTDEKVEKVDPAKLVGKWELKETQSTFEFTKDGKLVIEAEGKREPGERTYTLDGRTLSTVSKDGDRERRGTRTVVRLTDTELVLGDGTAKDLVLTRVKDKK